MFWNFIFIVGASVSSGFSGTPSGQYIAEWMNYPYQNEARIAQKLSEFIDTLKIPANSLVINLDSSYWDSYNRDCSKAIEAVNKFYDKTKEMMVVISTVPNRNAGGFYRFIAGAEEAEQVCLQPINKVIIQGCIKNCILLNADTLYNGKENEDIHLTPQTWKDVAVYIVTRLSDGTNN